MLLRSLTDGYLLIPQPSHARVSGQIAAAWRRNFFPRDDISLAAAIHDIGWCREEQALLLNPKTGLPYDFLHLPKARHVEIWTRASESALAFGRYVALMVSRHGTALYADFDYSKLPALDKTLVQGYVQEQKRFQEQLIASLQQDRYYAQYITGETLAQNTKLILLFDLMSIVLCIGFSEQMPFNSPDFSMKPSADKETVIVEPWPFSASKISLLVEGRKLSGKFQIQQQLDEALAKAKWQSFIIELIQVE